MPHCAKTEDPIVLPQKVEPIILPSCQHKLLGQEETFDCIVLAQITCDRAQHMYYQQFINGSAKNFDECFKHTKMKP